MVSFKSDDGGPSIKWVFAFGVMALLLGCFLGLVSLVSQPVKEVNTLPDSRNEEKGAVYYIQGTSSGGASWRSKRVSIMSEGIERITVSEGDLNQWASSELKRDSKKVVAKDGEEPKEEGLFQLEVTKYNFLVAKDSLQVGGYVTFPKLFPGRIYVCQVRGRLVSSRNGPHLKITEGYLGKAPIGYIPGLRIVLEKLFMNSVNDLPEFEEIRAIWPTFNKVELQDDQMIFLRS